MRRKSFFAVLAAAIFVLCLTLTVSGVHEVADVSMGSSGIYWQPKVSYSQISLTVSCPSGQVFQKTFKGGAAPYFDLSAIKGQSRDGSYTYELRVTPLDAKKTRKDGNAPKKIMSGDIPRFKSLSQTGYFSVSGGAIITPGAVSERGNKPVMTQGDPATPSDQVILDDLIVGGSICAGMDCINGESFGFDTIRLKENNLRIRFQDTSTSASFPTNDWQITANDSANGGANKFSIDDIDAGKTPFTIEAGAGANALYVDDYGRVGFGTSTPVVELEIAEGDTPTVRLNQDGTSGWSPQVWDVAGNEANFFIRDVTNGSKLSFRIQPGTPASTLSLKASGNVGIGTWDPDKTLHVETTGANCAILAERTDGASNVMNATTTASNFGSLSDHPVNIVTNKIAHITIDTAGNVGIGNETPGQLFVVGSAGTAYCDGTDWYPTSTREAKENIVSLGDAEALQALNSLDPVKYNYKVNKAEERLGFIAEDVPEIVAINGRKSVISMDIVAVLTKVVQEQQKAVAQHAKTISELKKEISELKKNR